MSPKVLESEGMENDIPCKTKRKLRQQYLYQTKQTFKKDFYKRHIFFLWWAPTPPYKKIQNESELNVRPRTI